MINLLITIPSLYGIFILAISSNIKRDKLTEVFSENKNNQQNYFSQENYEYQCEIKFANGSRGGK